MAHVSWACLPPSAQPTKLLWPRVSSGHPLAHSPLQLLVFVGREEKLFVLEQQGIAAAAAVYSFLLPRLLLWLHYSPITRPVRPRRLIQLNPVH
ncbi:unnamed protein product [Linum trigynum]|uniref:Uncharacterized protein n=1 Tax=Linum trigynum TaxID=586398 RepID=A0AAV2EZA7_9ROSI